jgi:hypothetical protein
MGKASCDHTCLPRFHSTPCEASSSLQHSDWLEPRSSRWGGGDGVAMWRSRNFTPLHSLAGPIGSTECFPSRVSGLCARDAPTLTMEQVSCGDTVSLQFNNYNRASLAWKLFDLNRMLRKSKETIGLSYPFYRSICDCTYDRNVHYAAGSL